MSSQMTTGQIIGSIGGAVIGGMIGAGPGAMIGMSIGGLVGGMIDPPPAPEPPPAGNISLNSYVHNMPVAIAYGQLKLYGGCIYLGPASVNMEEGGSKKSPEYSPNMSIQFAMAQCEGPISDYVRHWFNEQPTDDAPDYGEGMSFSVTEHLGGASQTVDPTMSTNLSGAAAPACPFIYTAYVYVDAFFSGGYFTSIPNYATEVKALLVETGEEDANPIRVLYDFLTNDRYGATIPTTMFDGDPDTADTSWYTEAAYCDEIVSYEDEDGTTVNEARFRYSNAWTQRTKGYDIVKDICMSCRCILSWCQGKLFVNIEKDDEPVVGYFSEEYQHQDTCTGSSTVDRIYFTSALTEPSGFWEAAIVSFEVNGKTYEEVVDTQGSDYVDVIDSLPVAPANGTTITLTKDNIKEGSFAYNGTSAKDRKNVIRVEFINRKWYNEEEDTINNDYQWDVYEHNEPSIFYKANGGDFVSLEDANQLQIRLNGVKRKSQAMRMAKYYGEYQSYINWYCEFVTDTIGYLYKVGDIIGVRHTQTGWEDKLFRVIAMEEIDNDEVKLMCIEYSRYIYSDGIEPCHTSIMTAVPSIYAEPSDIPQFHVVQDAQANKMYLLIERPDDQWWMGARIYLKLSAGDSYTNMVAQIGHTAPNVKLNAAISDSATTIAFDNTTAYGSFPDSGSFWIDSELITYTSIDAVNYEFEGCTRGTSGTTAAAHDATDYCWLKEENTPYIEFDDSQVGQTYYFAAISYNITGGISDISSAATFTLTVA